MSGRKQHYIPQFLLRGFAEPGAGKNLQVRVIAPDRTFACGTNGIAAEREFYSRLDDGLEALDHVVTRAEEEYALLYRSLLATNHGDLAPAEVVARLLTHLTVRALHTRETVTIGGQYAVKRVSDLLKDPAFTKARLGISRGRPSVELQSKLDEFYNLHKMVIQKQGLSRHDFRRYAMRKLSENWTELARDLHKDVDHLTSFLGLRDMVVTGHQKVLMNSLEPAERVDALADLKWEAIRLDQKVFVLPDSIAIAHGAGVGACPFGFVANEELSGIIFPLSPRMALCAGAYRSRNILATLLPTFPVYAAMCSLRFLVLPPSMPFDPSVSDRIGEATSQLIVNTIERAVTESLADAFS